MLRIAILGYYIVAIAALITSLRVPKSDWDSVRLNAIVCRIGLALSLRFWILMPAPLLFWIWRSVRFLRRRGQGPQLPAPAVDQVS